MTLNHRVRRTRVVHLPVLAVLVTLAVSGGAHAQGQGGRAPAGPPPSAKAAAPIDLTGYWVSIVTQDWRQRMVTPPRGDYESVPITAEAKKVGDGWDPAKDEAAGEQCRSYGAPALMRVPGRVRITWQDDTTLKVELDAGEQTRLFHFGSRAPAGASASWQGYSVAGWETPGGAQPKSGSLKVVTTQLRPGYLRKNGVPYSADAVLTEHWDLFTLANGEAWITITSTVVDPLYLRTPWLTALHFKKEPDGSKWDPSPCSASW
jgi:hypothetical protein